MLFLRLLLKSGIPHAETVRNAAVTRYDRRIDRIVSSAIRRIKWNIWHAQRNGNMSMAIDFWEQWRCFDRGDRLEIRRRIDHLLTRYGYSISDDGGSWEFSISWYNKK